MTIDQVLSTRLAKLPNKNRGLPHTLAREPKQSRGSIAAMKFEVMLKYTQTCFTARMTGTLSATCRWKLLCNGANSRCAICREIFVGRGARSQHRNEPTCLQNKRHAVINGAGAQGKVHRRSCHQGAHNGNTKEQGAKTSSA